MVRTIISCDTGDEARMIRLNAQKAEREGEDVILRYSERVSGKFNLTIDHASNMSEKELIDMLKGASDE